MRAITALCLTAMTFAGVLQPEDTRDVAGWRDTRWGMTEDEVLAALKGEAQRVPSPWEHNGVVDTLEIPKLDIGPYHFHVTLSFKGGKLSNVILTGDKDASLAYAGVKDMLVAKYGAAASEGPEMLGRHAQWNFPSTRIVLTEIRTSTSRFLSLSYSQPEKDLNKL